MKDLRILTYQRCPWDIVLSQNIFPLEIFGLWVDLNVPVVMTFPISCRHFLIFRGLYYYNHNAQRM